MKKTAIFIFTYRYPYNPPTEQFLDMELPYFIKENTDIFLIPTAREIDCTEVYESAHDENINIIPLQRHSKIKEIRKAVTACPAFLGDLIRDMHEVSNSIPQQVRTFAEKLTFQQYVQAQGEFIEMKEQFPIELFTKYDKVILYSYWLDATALSLCYLKEYLQRNMQGRIVAFSRAHGQGDLYQGELENYRPGHRLLQSNLDRIFPISRDGCVHLKKQGIDNTILARLGVPTALASYPHSVGNVEKSRILIVSCSTVNENKRVQKIAEIISGIRKYSINWVHFGGGELEENVKRWCKQNMPSNIQWNIAGKTSHQEIMNFYAQNAPDLFVNMSRVEGIPVSIMEAFSYGIPCLATQTGATAEIVEDGINGFLFSVDFDSQQATDVILNYLAMNCQVKKKICASAFETWNNEYSTNKNYQMFSKLVCTCGDELTSM